MPVNLLANNRDSPLIDRSSISCLDRCKIGFAGLVSCAGTPAMGLEEICRQRRLQVARERCTLISVDGTFRASREIRRKSAMRQVTDGPQLLSGEIHEALR